MKSDYAESQDRSLLNESFDSILIGAVPIDLNMRFDLGKK